MKRDLKEFVSFVKFGIVGVVNTLINWIVFFILNEVGVYYIIANVIAYLIATINSYIWNSIWVFKYKNRSKLKASLKFIVLNLFGLLINTTILYLLVDIFKLKELISLIVATGIVMIINYILNKFWVFKKESVTSVSIQ